ncbi:hypothetical protein J7E25_09825 [Agromyces sp. ISL-38]|uniref:hypothetical protein n=1 Tax=Agromyces sp. ISL-38 TaxID=2819107 RepID=UPI001BE5D4D6|nr:hypothetical protein [Agromyces sp. ISL-38]MBT2499398.1 hypothetical protein [Agromyces sp. ISL-38]
MTDSQIEIIDVGELSLKEARAMVADLAAGLTLPPGLGEHLANQAREAPYVAVVALNLARRGELQPGYLRLDDGIRRQVLARYEDVLIGSPHGFDTDLVKRFLATVAALGTVDFTDADTQLVIGDFLGMKRTDVLRLAKALTEQGAFVTKEKVSRVIPEVLADQVLESEAIAFGSDTGFVSELWAAFGDSDDWRLLTNLASLEWRLTSQGLPSVIGPIWDQIREFIDVASLRTLQAFLGASADLAFSQPVRLMETLLRIRERLNYLTSNPSEVVEDELFVSVWGGRPIQVGDVEKTLPKLFADCARNDASLLEQALDEIWSLARTDNRPTNQFTEHPRRVIIDSLADIGNLADPSFPSRIVERVRLWLQTPGAASDAATPLFPLTALLAKEGSRVRLADRRTIQFEPFLVNAEWAHPIRDEIRSVLVEQGLADDIRRAAQAVKLLTDTLRSPHGQFGLVIDQEAVESWEADDLDTMTALEAIADGTAGHVVRRLIRRGIEWHARRAASPTVKKRAYRLLVQLDQLVDDDLAEILLPSHFTTVPSQRGVLAEAWGDPDSDLDGDSESAMRRMERDSAARRRQAVEVADSLWHTGLSEESLAQIAQTLDEIALALEDDRDGLAMLFQAVAVERRQYLPGLIERVEDAQHPVMDAQLHVLLVGLLMADRPAALVRLTSMGTAREAVRLAAARMYNSLESENRADLHDLREQGMRDASEPVCQEYLASMGPDLVASVASTANALMGQQAEPKTIERVLFDAWRIDEDWAAELSPDDAAQVIKLIVASDWTEWMAQHILVKLAPLHLALILDSLMGVDGLSETSRHSLDHELIEAFRMQPTVVADWLVSEIRAGTEAGTLDSILEIIGGESFSQSLGDAIATHIPDLNAEQTAELVRSLASSQTWAATSPALALAVLTNARNNGAEMQTEIEEQVSYGTRPHHWSGSNGVSDELNAALAANEQAAADETDPHLHTVFEQSAEVLRAMIERDRRDFEDDEDEDK